jgi:adenosylcobinamide kinase / adenosylcobinamide-phosphate guanylyltransferase
VITLVLGGTRSGKTAVAERVAAGRPGPVHYVATGTVTDAGMAARIAAHRARRPPGWATVELPTGGDLAALVRATPGTLLVDALGTWVAGWTPSLDPGALDPGATDTSAPDPATVDPAAAGRALAHALAGRDGDAVVVSDEVGLAVHPLSAVGRWFVDALGDVNQAVAAVADDVLLVVAGRVLRLPRPDEVLGAPTLDRPGARGDGLGAPPGDG